jgi:hypothetical protein
MMGSCLSLLAGESGEDMVLHREVEEQLKEVCIVKNCAFSAS